MANSSVDFEAESIEIQAIGGKKFNCQAYGFRIWEVLANFDVKDIVEHFGSAELLNHIGEKEAKRHFEIE